MSDQSTTKNDREERAARLTAFVLDELAGDERSKVEAELLSVPNARQVCDELAQVAEELQSSEWNSRSLEPSPELRAAVLERLTQNERPVELPKSRGRFSRRRWALVISVSAALLLLAIPLQRTLVPTPLAQKFEKVLLPQTRPMPDDVDAFVLVDSPPGKPIKLTEVEAKTLAALANLPVENLSDGEAPAALVKQLEDRIGQSSAEKVLTDLSSDSSGATVQAEELSKLYAAIADLEAEKKQREESLRQQEQVQIRAIMKEAEITRQLSTIVGLPDGASVAAPAQVSSAVGSRGKRSSTQLAGQSSAAHPYIGPFYPAPQVPKGWARQQLQWDTSGWQLNYKQVDTAGKAVPPAAIPPAYGAYVQPYYATRAKDAYSIPEQDSKRLRGRVRQQSEARDSRLVGNEQYTPIVENQFAAVEAKPVSTFSIDVDTASYANVRRFLTQKQLPPPNAVRLEELVNYFHYDYPEPEGKDPFSVSMEVAQCPWQPVHQLLRIGLKGKDVARQERPATSLVFLLDVSGSMQDENKLPLLKRAMKLLTDQLTENDRVTIVTYAGDAGLALDTTNGENKTTIRKSIDALNADGSTNGSAGIQLAYEKATEAFTKDGANRVVLATDGDLNVGVTEDGELVKLIAEKAKSGVFLTVLGFGEGNLKDGKLEKLADNGNGMYAYVDSFREARKVLAEQISGSLVTIAKDVKVKVEFNPAEVAAYRLLGYENRLMTAAEFNDDKKDAGEIGAGHTVTALYEIVPKTEQPKLTAAAGELKYQRVVEPVEPPKELTDAAKTGELLTLYLRYKQPDEDESTFRESVVKNERRAFDAASADFRFAASVASFGMQLRGSQYRGSTSFAAIEETAASAIGDDPRQHRTEFVDLVRRASELVGKERK